MNRRMNMAIRYSLPVFCLAYLAMTGSNHAAGQENLTGKLTLTGSSTIAPLVSDLAKKFEKTHPGVRVDVQTGGSSRGVLDARQGTADIGMVSRALKEDEQDLKSYPIALDGICVIVHSTNPVKELTDSQIVAIYTGRVKNWKDVGGLDKQIMVVNKAEGRSTLELFLHYTKLKLPDIKADVIIGDNEQGIKTVAGNPYSVAYVSIGTAEYNATHGTQIKLLPLHGIQPSMQALIDHKFALSRPLNLVTKTEPTGIAKEFIAFAAAPENDSIVKGQYFVPLAKR